MRSRLVNSRTQLINSVRGTLRSHGYRVRSYATCPFATEFPQLGLPSKLVQILAPLIEQIHGLSKRIEALGRELGELAQLDELWLPP